MGNACVNGTGWGVQQQERNNPGTTKRQNARVGGVRGVMGKRGSVVGVNNVRKMG